MSDLLVVIGTGTVVVAMAWAISRVTVWCLSKWEDRR